MKIKSTLTLILCLLMSVVKSMDQGVVSNEKVDTLFQLATRAVLKYLENPLNYISCFKDKDACINYWYPFVEKIDKNIPLELQDHLYPKLHRHNFCSFAKLKNACDALSSNGRYWATTQFDAAGSNLLLFTFPALQLVARKKLNKSIYEIMWNSDNTHLITSPSQNFDELDSIDIWNIKTWSLVNSLQFNFARLDLSSLQQKNLVKCSDNGRFIFLRNLYNSAGHIFDVVTNGSWQMPLGEARYVQKIYDSSQSVIFDSYFYVSFPYPSKKTSCWSINQKKYLWEEWGDIAKMSPQGKMIALILKNNNDSFALCVRELSSDKILYSIPLSIEVEKNALVFSDDESTLWVGDKNSHTIFSYCMKTGTLLQSIKLPHQYGLWIMKNGKFVGSTWEGVYFKDNSSSANDYKKIFDKARLSHICPSLSLVMVAYDEKELEIFNTETEQKICLKFPYDEHYPALQTLSNYLIVHQGSRTSFMRLDKLSAQFSLPHLLLKTEYEKWLAGKASSVSEQSWSDRLNTLPHFTQCLKDLPDALSYLCRNEENPA